MHEHVTGDLTLIKPANTFQGFKPMTRVNIPLVLEYWSVQETDNMPVSEHESLFQQLLNLFLRLISFVVLHFISHYRDGLLLTIGKSCHICERRYTVLFNILISTYGISDGSTAVIQNTDTEEMHNFVVPYTSTVKTAADNNIPITAASRFTLNLKTVEEVDAASTRIIPAPYKTNIGSNANTFSIDGLSLGNVQLIDVLVKGAFDLLSKLDVMTNGNHPVSFTSGDLPTEIAGAKEAYTLDITAQGTTITATDPAGFFNGLMSFIGLLDIKNNNVMTLKEMTVIDKPRFEYRGHQVDAARNFRSKETILKTIDAMALWKVR